MAFTTTDFTTAVRDRVSSRVFSTPYASLTTENQAIIDDAGTDALVVLNQYGPFYDFTNQKPDTWLDWLGAEAGLIAVQVAKPDRERVFESRRYSARQSALATTTEDALADNATNVALTLNGIRRYLIRVMATRGKFPQVGLIDIAAEWAINDVYNRKDWGFRRHQATLTIGPDSSVTVDSPASTSIAKIMSRRLWFSGTGLEDNSIAWANEDTMAHALTTLTTAGQPVWFRVYETDGSLVWKFAPTPDKEYTVRCEILEKGPPTLVGTASTATDPVAPFPSEFGAAIRNRALAKLKVDTLEPDGQRSMVASDEEIDLLSSQVDDMGRPNDHGIQEDVYGDFNDLSDSFGVLGGRW